jgi:predicted RNase H-like nuclease
MKLAGIDLAWRSNKNPTALAVGSLTGTELVLTGVAKDLFGVAPIIDYLSNLHDLAGIAIDGPLMIENSSGQRKCETLIGKEYGSRYASCHTSNLSLFPSADSVQLSRILSSMGFQHLGATTGKWQIECYPHPALIEIFTLKERHQYKKGPISTKRRGQCELADFLLRLVESDVLRLTVPDGLSQTLSHRHIESLSGTALKQNEDILDAIVCLYVGGLYAIGIKDHVFGDAVDGYIYVPQVPCILG